MVPRTYFLHVPKTAGVTLKTYLENQVPADAVLAIDAERARTLPRATLNRFRVWSGHYDGTVLAALSPVPTTVVMLREPVARLRSWAAHGRRLTDPALHAPFAGRSDLAIATENDQGNARQASRLQRALRPDSASPALGDADLDTMLGGIDVVGLTEEFDRSLQLIAFRLGGTVPPLGWQLNRRPDASSTDDGEAAALREVLAIDVALHQRATTRFWDDYAWMLRCLAPARVTLPASPADVPLATVQAWLEAQRDGQRATAPRQQQLAVDIDGNDPVCGDGWWWRECPGPHAYRWTGPGTATHVPLGALSPALDYTVAVELCGAADWSVWNSLQLDVNGRPLALVREEVPPGHPRQITLRATARLPREVVARSRTTTLSLVVDHTRPVPGAPLVEESLDTRHRDVRPVGLAVQRITVAA